MSWARRIRQKVDVSWRRRDRNGRFATEVAPTSSATTADALSAAESDASNAPTPTSLAAIPADTPVEDLTYAVFDVETSDLDWNNGGRVIQVGVVVADGHGHVIDRWCSKVRPPDGRAGATHIHGISDEDLIDAPTFADVAPEVMARMNGRIRVAHNAPFDTTYLDNELGAAGWHVTDHATLDTLDLARQPDPDGNRHPSNKLGELCSTYGVSLTNAHSADADAEATANLVPHLLARVGVGTVGDLRQNQAIRHDDMAADTAPDPVVAAQNRAAFRPRPSSPRKCDGHRVYDQSVRYADAKAVAAGIDHDDVAPILVPRVSKEKKNPYWVQEWGGVPRRCARRRRPTGS